MRISAIILKIFGCSGIMGYGRRYSLETALPTYKLLYEETACKKHS
jgi:hypothetical protein